MIIDPLFLNAQQLDPIMSRKILFSGDGYTVAYMHSVPGQGGVLHKHPHAQFIYVLSGTGAFQVNEQIITATANQCIPVGSNIPHGVHHVDDEMIWLEFFTPERNDIKPAE